MSDMEAESSILSIHGSESSFIINETKYIKDSRSSFLD